MSIRDELRSLVDPSGDGNECFDVEGHITDILQVVKGHCCRVSKTWKDGYEIYYRTDDNLTAVLDSLEVKDVDQG